MLSEGGRQSLLQSPFCGVGSGGPAVTGPELQEASQISTAAWHAALSSMKMGTEPLPPSLPLLSFLARARSLSLPFSFYLIPPPPLPPFSLALPSLTGPALPEPC